MDPAAADQPCIIQALAANCNNTLPPPPPLVQALAAHQHPTPPKTNPPPPPPPQSSPAATKRRAAPSPAPPSPRRTRSGGAPGWTPAETLALVAEVAAVDDGWSRSVSAFQKWAMVAENLAASEAFAPGPGTRSRRGSGSGNKRTAGECRRRWEALEAEYGAVRRWEVRSGGTYWEMGAAARRKAGLPAEFDAEVYGAMDALIRVEEALLADAAGGDEVEGLVGGGAGVEVDEQGGGAGVEVEVDEQGGSAGVEVDVQGNGDPGETEVGKEQVQVQVQEDASAGEEEPQEKEEEEAGEEEEEEDEEDVDEDGEEMQEGGGNADALNDLEGHGMGTSVEPEKSPNIAWELANKLHENAQHIHTILNEEAAQDAGRNNGLGGLMLPDAMEATRQKADDLIQTLGGLVSYLNQFTELVKETGFENIAGMT